MLKLAYDINRHKAPHSEPSLSSLLYFSGVFRDCEGWLSRILCPNNSFIPSGSYLHSTSQIIINPDICISTPLAVIRKLSLMVKSSLHGEIFPFLLLKEIVFLEGLPIVCPCFIKEKMQSHGMYLRGQESTVDKFIFGHIQHRKS